VYLKQFFLEKSDFSDCYLRKANFNKAILWHANFSNADLTDATFVDAKIQGANFSGAKLTQAQVDSVKEGSLTTILPENLHPPETWGHWCDSNRENCFLKKDCAQYLCRNNEDSSSFLKIEADEKNP